MTQSNTPNKRRLFKLLDRIIDEEQNFKRQSRTATSQSQSPEHLPELEEQAVIKDGLSRLHDVHEELFKVHSKFLDEHELLIQRCLAISRQTRAGLLNENEMAMEVERLQSELRRIKKEHSLVEKECRQILQAEGQSTKDVTRND